MNKPSKRAVKKDGKSKMTQLLIVAIDKTINEFDPELPISSIMVARLTAKALDPGSLSPPPIAYAAELEIRQLTRGRLRVLGGEETENDTVDMFEKLQNRYPVEREGDLVSVPRHLMTFDEYMMTASRLMREGQAKIAHADALKREALEKMASGYFKKMCAGQTG